MARNMKCSDTGKDIHFSAGTAEQSALRLGAKHNTELYTYRCKLCGYWHLTHQRRQAVIRQGISA